MSNVIIINSHPNEMRAAMLSGGIVQEFFVERMRKRTLVGNIYKGRVVKVLPGMQSVFVDIGGQRAAFLHVADVVSISDDGLMSEFASDLSGEQSVSIEELIKDGQELVVQVTKDATGNKGARLTMRLSIPGRHLVLMPGYPHVGVSRRIDDEEEREKLRATLKHLRPEKCGLIARTVSKGQSDEDIIADRDYLLRVWDKVQAQGAISGAPKMLYEDDNLIFRLLRDVADEKTSQIIIDNKKDYTDMRSFCSDYRPELFDKIIHYDKRTSLFDAYNIELEIDRMLDKKVWLRSGGYIVIDQTEALTVIDVNTGKFVGQRNFEETIFQTNIEAAREIAHQLRLRNIGGIIIIDFIDMDIVENRGKVIALLDELLKDDRARASVVNITPLGLVEVTRKRAQESVLHKMSEPCPYCDGRGVVKARLAICYDILRNIRRTASERSGGTIVLEAHNEIVDILVSNERESLDAIEKEFNVKVEARFQPHTHLEHYELK
ncbi:ribonuclease G [Deferribacterales bacterium RsTz2092]|nr:ribonuclease G [Deferribacterales bacterium]